MKFLCQALRLLCLWWIHCMTCHSFVYVTLTFPVAARPYIVLSITLPFGECMILPFLPPNLQADARLVLQVAARILRYVKCNLQVVIFLSHV
jgi:hypothetical protein